MGTTDRATWIRRALLASALLAAVWAGFIAVTGGFATQLGGVRVSSRNIRNPILLALLSACTAVALSRRNPRRVVDDDLRWWWSKAQSARRSAAGRWWVRRIHPVTLIATAGAALLMYQWSRARPLWLDEEMIALNIRDRSLSELAGSLWLGQSAPFGWLATQRAVMLLMGVGETAVRFVPVVFGVATVGVALWVGRRWMTALGAGALVLLCALGQWAFHYSLELKHYSADMFFGLTLPALVVWAIEADRPDHRLRRAAIWWTVAAIGQWWANGALLVTPACALLLWIALWRIDGRRSALLFALCAIAWLASFVLHYQSALRFTLASDYLRELWSFAMPPASAGVTGTVRWLLGQAAPFAIRPGGSELTTLFWVAALGGFLTARPRVLGYVVATVPLSACVLAAVRVAPLYERVSLWTVPALYVGIALCIDAAVRWGRDAYKRRLGARAALAGFVSIAGLWLCVDIVGRGWRDIEEDRPPSTNHQLDDRTAVKWLVAQHRPGDAVLTTVLALPAVWWYGGVPVSPPASGGSLPDGSPILEVFYRAPGAECDDELRRALVPYERALVYFGFRFDDVPEGFDDLLLRELGLIGRVTEPQRFSGITRAVLVDIAPVQRPADAAAPNASRSTSLDGCVSVRPAVRW